jgi:hypothetical protein
VRTPAPAKAGLLRVTGKDSNDVVNGGSMKNKKLTVGAYLAGLGPIAMTYLFLLSGAATCRAQEAGAPYPVVYSTDLYYTIDDIDDHFDAATLLKSPEVNLKGIILEVPPWNLWVTREREKE